MKSKLFSLFIVLNFSSIFAQTYTWSASGDGVSLYQEANWELNGNPPAANQINPNSELTFNLLIDTYDARVGGNGFNGRLLLGGNILTLNRGQIKGNDEIASFAGNSNTSFLNASGGNIVCKALNNLTVTVQNSVGIVLSDPTNLVLNGTTVNLDASFSGIITLSNVSISDFNANELSKFTVNGVPAADGVNVSLTDLEGVGTALTLVNQPDSGNNDYSDSPQPNNGPNIIYILLDDLGYGDLGSLWQNQITGDKKMMTPNLDTFANEGATLSHHYASAPVCAPSRSSFLEGLNQGHSSIRNNQFDKVLKEGLTIAELLSKAGYRTMHVGKYGTGGGRNSAVPGHPLHRGFDQFYGFLFHSQGHIHYPENGTTNKRSYFIDGFQDVLTKTDLTYTTDVFTAKSKQWIETHRATRPEQPFFLYLAYDVPHSALDVPTQAYPDGGGLTGGLQWTSINSTTPWVNTASGIRNDFIHPDYASENWTNAEKKHATMIKRVDNAVADLIQLLQDLNIDDETLIVFSSDNGPHNSGGYNPQSFQSYANFNGIKRDMWEGGIRMPTICRFPGTIPENSTVTFPSGQWDWYATFADLAGVPIPSFTDGVSLLPSLTQNNANQVDKGFLYHEYSQNGSTPNYSDFEASIRGRTRKQMQVIRMGDYKGIRYDITDHSDPFEIYNLVTDPRESNNLASSMPMLEQEMREKVLQVRKRDDSAPRPYDNELIPNIPGLSLSNGLQKNIYQSDVDWVPNFDYLSPTVTTTANNIDEDAQGETTPFGMSYKGYLNITTDGLYTFYLTSSAKTHIKIHEIHLLDNDFSYSASEISADLFLKAGMHPIKIEYQQNTASAINIDLQLEGPNLPKASIPDSMFFTESTLATDEVLFANNIKLYPQPVKDQLTIFISEPEDSYDIVIYSILGQEVVSENKRTNLNTQTLSLNLSNLASGIYLLKLSNNDSNNFVRKFIKQ